MKECITSNILIFLYVSNKSCPHPYYFLKKTIEFNIYCIHTGNFSSQVALKALCDQTGSLAFCQQNIPRKVVPDLM